MVKLTVGSSVTNLCRAVLVFSLAGLASCRCVELSPRLGLRKSNTTGVLHATVIAIRAVKKETSSSPDVSRSAALFWSVGLPHEAL